MTGLIDGLWDVALLGGHRRDQVRNISTDVLRQVIKVAALSVALTVARPGAALPDRATRDRAANRLDRGLNGRHPPARANHSVSGTT